MVKELSFDENKLLIVKTIKNYLAKIEEFEYTNNKIICIYEMFIYLKWNIQNIKKYIGNNFLKTIYFKGKEIINDTFVRDKYDMIKFIEDFLILIN